MATKRQLVEVMQVRACACACDALRLRLWRAPLRRGVHPLHPPSSTLAFLNTTFALLRRLPRTPGSVVHSPPGARGYEYLVTSESLLVHLVLTSSAASRVRDMPSFL